MARGRAKIVAMDSTTPLLDTVRGPSDIRGFDTRQLKQLAGELREDTVQSVSFAGGHLGASLGVVELTVALHHVFDTPRDRLIWDVGHQCYPHKILTGRRDRMRTLRQGGGLAGFTNRKESEFDSFGAGHSSTSISVGLGMAVARDLAAGDNHVICVIGDGSMTAGMAYEAMNNAGAMDARLIVILNDNDMSIAPPVGTLSAYLSRLISSKPFRSARDLAKEVAKKLPRQIEEAVATVADARFAKPLDEDLIRRLAREHEALVTIEENAAGGFAAHVLQFLANKGLLENGLKVRVMTMPDEFIDHNKPDTQYELAGLQSSHIVDNVLAALGCADEADSAVLTHLA